MTDFDLVDARNYIAKITVGRLTYKQISRTLAFLRAKRIVFFNVARKRHVLIPLMTNEQKIQVLESLKIHHG